MPVQLSNQEIELPDTRVLSEELRVKKCRTRRENTVSNQTVEQSSQLSNALPSFEKLSSFAEIPKAKPDLVCFSHLRWDWVYQRPQHLLKRSAADRRVFFFEEPIFNNGSLRLEVHERDNGVLVVVPHLPEGLLSQVATIAVVRDMLNKFFEDYEIREYVAWYYTPMALEFTRDLQATRHRLRLYGRVVGFSRSARGVGVSRAGVDAKC